MQDTVIAKVDPARPSDEIIDTAAGIIKKGGLVAFPTETVYGLGADATRESAIRRIFEAKGRPADNPLIIHVSERSMLSGVAAEVGPKAELLIDKFWPGPLTLVVERGPLVAQSACAELGTVAVRMPRGRVALSLIEKAGTPIAAPSANSSGHPSPTEARHVAADLGGKIEMILDAGPTDIGIESTVLDMTSDPPSILRPGWITGEQLRSVIGPVNAAATEEALRRSPGTRHRHYSPRTKVILVERATPEFLRDLCTRFLKNGRVGFVGHTSIGLADAALAVCLLKADAADYARSIFSALRMLDDQHLDIMVVEGIVGGEQAAAVMDRLRRAASEVVAGDQTEHRLT